MFAFAFAYWRNFFLLKHTGLIILGLKPPSFLSFSAWPLMQRVFFLFCVAHTRAFRFCHHFYFTLLYSIIPEEAAATTTTHTTNTNTNNHNNSDNYSCY